MTQVQSNRDYLSWASVVSRHTLGNLTIPPTSLENFYEEVSEPYMLVIFSPSKRSLKIEVIPVESKNVVKLQLILDYFSQETFKHITQIFSKLKIENIHTSGVCLKEGLCVYEAYIETTKLTHTDEEIKKMFRTIKGLRKVHLSQVD